MKNFLSKILKSKKIALSAVLFFLAFGVLIVIHPAWAVDAGDVISGTVGAAVATLVGWLTSILSAVIGLILTLLIKILVNVAQFSNIIKVDAVETGWVIVRDLCNMFFILILLIIAFATILRIESYNAKKLLPKLLIMAVLINFSKTICGLIIDFAQVIMLTFVNGFADNGAGNFINLFNIQNYQSIKVLGSESAKAGEAKITNFAVAGAFIAGLIAMIITTIVVAVMLAVLVMRIVMLWVYVILSPIAFLASAFPAGQKYSSQWWGDFSKNVIVGPVLAFFIWLALTTASQSSGQLGSFGVKKSEEGGEICAGINSFFCEKNFQTYIITIALLIGGLMVTQQIGGIAGSAAGKGMAAIQKGKGLAMKGVAGIAGYGARKFAAWDKGFEIRPTKIIAGMKESFQRGRERDELAARQRGAKLMAKGGLRGVLGGAGVGADWADHYFTGFANIKGFKNMAKSVRWGERSRNKIKNNLGGLTDFEKLMNNESKLTKERESLTGRDADIRRGEIDKNLEEIEKKKDELSKKFNISPTINPENLNSQIKKTKDKLAEIKPPASYEARAAYRTMVEGEKTKLKGINNSDELTMLYNDAAKRKDKYRAAAILEKLTSDANENEVLNDKGYDSTAIGLHQFIQKEVIGKGLMSKEEALNLQNDISSIAEEKNHWEVAKTVGVNQFGELESLIRESRDEKGNTVYDDSNHALAANAEILKIDPQKRVNAMNRLAVGGETPNPDGTRTFNLSTLGKMLVVGSQQIFKDQKSRILSNTAFNLTQPHVMVELNKLGIDPEVIKILEEKGKIKGVSLAPHDILADLKKKGLV